MIKMILFLIVYLVVLLPNQINAQTYTVVLQPNCIVLDSIVYDNAIMEDFLSYDYYFLGEQHETENIAKTEIKIISLLIKNKRVEYFINETPVFFQPRYNNLLKTIPKDTNSAMFENVSGYNNNEKEILRYLYCYSQISNGIKIKPIDIINAQQFNKRDYLEILSPHMNKEIRKDSKSLKKISNNFERHYDINKKYFIEYYDLFIKKEQYYVQQLGNNFVYYKQLLKAFKVFLDLKEMNHCECNSPLREEFMYQNIEQLLGGDKNCSFISSNGINHINLQKGYELDSMPEWEPLAYKVKNRFTDKKVCSIYFMSRKNDRYADTYFPNERKFIIQNTSGNCIIKIHGNPELDKLSNLFQYLVVY